MSQNKDRVRNIMSNIHGYLKIRDIDYLRLGPFRQNIIESIVCAIDQELCVLEEKKKKPKKEEVEDKQLSLMSDWGEWINKQTDIKKL